MCKRATRARLRVRCVPPRQPGAPCTPTDAQNPVVSPILRLVDAFTQINQNGNICIMDESCTVFNRSIPTGITFNFTTPISCQEAINQEILVDDDIRQCEAEANVEQPQVKVKCVHPPGASPRCCCDVYIRPSHLVVACGCESTADQTSISSCSQALISDDLARCTMSKQFSASK
ncbi:unnamed protein product [Haemonchus placei]|uniref:Phlebovirus_G2 domain-containing protein n=1 Tax=Haemonchus placei TaxID=6290 RepID=A0A0N4WZF7_HAEPC|nr:unnamed protein product [Haemonchus placei]